MSCDLITSNSICHIFKTTADRMNMSSVPETRENYIRNENKIVSRSILRQSNWLVKVLVRIHCFTPVDMHIFE